MAKKKNKRQRMNQQEDTIFNEEMANEPLSEEAKQNNKKRKKNK